jgi:hypothetical protein
MNKYNANLRSSGNYVSYVSESSGQAFGEASSLSVAPSAFVVSIESEEWVEVDDDQAQNFRPLAKSV